MRAATLAIAGVLMSAATARAEPTAYVQADAFWLLIYGTAGAEGGLRLGDTPIWGHAEASISSSAWEMRESGSGSQLSAGAEARGCTSGGGLCGTVGLDVGVVTSSWDAPYDPSIDYQASDIDLIPRAVVDVGGKTVRFRFGLEIYSRLARASYQGGDAAGGRSAGAKPVMGLAYQW